MSIKRNIPLTRTDHIRVYRKKNAAIRHEYYSLSSKHSHLSKTMLTFTASGKGRGVYTKLRLINEIKSYVTYLIANSKSDIYFFSNIEIGHTLSNPHLHTQIWSDDENAVSEIYGRVIAKFSLDKKRCAFSLPQQQTTFYNYIIKDYSKDLSDNDLWNLEQTKKRMRKTLGLKLRFYSRSKSKYTSKLYKMVYHSYKVLRALADSFLDFMVNTFFVKRSERQTVLDSKKLTFISSKSGFISIREQGVLFWLPQGLFLVFEMKYVFGDCMGMYFFAPVCAPPFYLLWFCMYFNFKGDVLFYLLWIWFFIPVLVILWLGEVGFVSLLSGCLCLVVCGVEVRCLSPPLDYCFVILYNYLTLLGKDFYGRFSYR